jgi:Cytochrome P460
MKSLRQSGVILAVMCTITIPFVFLSASRRSSQGAHGIPISAPAPVAAAAEIIGYRTWKQINEKPEYIMSKLDLMCVAPTQEQIAAEEKSNPHFRHYMLCYVNKIGEHAMMQEKHPHFPPGSIIVKEKLDQPSLTAHVSLLTCMIKRNPGFDRAHNDWEYVVCDGSNSVLAARGKLDNCGACHKEARDSDFVFRGELGQKRLASLMN